MIYLDYQATTPLAPEAREAMLRWLDGPGGNGFGNPHSAHRLGRLAGAAIDHARDQVAALFPPGGTVIFTASATEAINMAVQGCAPMRAGKAAAFGAIDHSAVIESLAARGKAHELAVGPDGRIDPATPLPSDLGLLALTQVNNEIGTIQPMEQMVDRARAAQALVLCDAVQAAGKIPIADADMIAISAHKMHGPKGIGALWLREGVSIAPLIRGGGQEGGLRSGTISPALCAGFGAAAALALDRMERDAAHVAALWDRARDLLRGWTLNGEETARYKGNMNVRREGIDVPRLMADARSVCFSTGSACASEGGRPSRVLSAIGLGAAAARSSIRLGWGRYTSMDELEQGIGAILAAAAMQE